MMKLKEWNEALQYAQSIADKFKEDGADVRVRPYTLYNGEKGIYLQAFDANGAFYCEQASGVHDDLGTMKKHLRFCEESIRSIL